VSSDLGALFYTASYSEVTIPGVPGLVALTRMLEAEGMSHVYTCEGYTDGLVGLAAMSAATTTINLGVGVVNIGLRHPYGLASEIASLAGLASGRLVVGLGAGHPEINGGSLHLQVDRPLRRVADYTTCVRQLLTSDGRPVSIATEHYTMDGAVVAWAPSEPVPIVLGALRPAMVKLAGSIADGVLLSNVPIHAIPDLKRVLVESALASGRAASDVQLQAIVNVVLRPSARDALCVYQEAMAGYVQLSSFQDSLRGYGMDAAALRDDDLHALGIIGTPEHARERIVAYREAGVDLVVLAPIELVGSDRSGASTTEIYAQLAQLAS
jgi:5,10-methylenetetrahydromethanopterin reductase